MASSNAVPAGLHCRKRDGGCHDASIRFPLCPLPIRHWHSRPWANELLLLRYSSIVIPVRRLISSLASMLLPLTLLSACAPPSGGSMPPSAPAPAQAPTSPILDSDGTPTAAALESISRARVFFAHRSVGANILELGIPQIYSDAGVTPPTITDGLPAAGGSIGDHWLDQTDDPRSKLRDFDAWMRSKGVGSATDVALMKFGYIDILKNTDVQGLFSDYKAMMTRLAADFPHVRFVHATVSMTRWDAENNASIESFNQLMRQEYGNSGRLFDLARVLSTCSNGTRDEHRTETGRHYFQICEEFTSDGGHLSELGAKAAAMEMLAELARVLNSR